MKLLKRVLPCALPTRVRARQRSMRSPLFRSLFVAGAAALLLATAFAPRAEAQTSELLYYFDFNGNSTNPSNPSNQPPFTSDAIGSIGGTFPLGQTTIFNGEGATTSTSNDFLFPSGAAAGMTIHGNGTTVNHFDAVVAGNNLQLRANDTTGSTQYCFTMGPMDFSGTALPGFQGFSITFALQQLNGGAPGHHGFTTLTLAYSFTGASGSWTNFKTFTNLQQYSSYTTLTANLPAPVNGHSTVYVSFCFVGATDTGVNNVTNIDNIQVLALTPEPSTHIGGLLGIAGLCWFQRRRLIRFLHLLPA